MIYGKVHNMSLLEEVNARVANKNAEILAERIAAYDKIEGPRVGDYLDFAEPQRSRYEGRTASSFRIAHDWGDRVQPACCGGDTGSFYFSVGSMSYSGGLTPPIPTSRLEATGLHRSGCLWFFSENITGAGRGVHFSAQFRVFRVLPEAGAEQPTNE
jgi:hypothetical protein